MESLEESHRSRIEGLEAIHREQMEELKLEIAALRERLAGLEEKHERPKLENSALVATVVEPERTEEIPLPPVGLGLLRFLKQRHYIVKISVSSHGAGNTDDLLAEDNTFWRSQSEPDSWIQWNITGGLKAIISSVKIRGYPRACGVADFIIECSNDGDVWTTILDSKTCPTTIENFVTQAEALPQPQRPFSIIRLTQTGPRYFPGHSTDHVLYLTYVDFGGKIVFPATARSK
jgi:hypothetical protein